MNLPQPQPTYNPMSAKDLTAELIAEALHIAKRYDRNLVNRDGTEAFPVPTRTARLLSLAIINLHDRLTAAQTPPKAKEARTEVCAPSLTREQRKALEAITSLLEANLTVTSRSISRIAGWKSHNTAAKHLRALVELGYLERASGKKRGPVILAARQP